MATHEAFQRAIRDEPDDDAHRLVYADWLDDHDDPVRAEFIRLQCTLNRCCPYSDEVQGLPFREQQLLKAHREGWEAPVLAGLDLPPPSRYAPNPTLFRRGFVEGVSLTEPLFRDYAPVLLTRTPLQSWTVLAAWEGQLYRNSFPELVTCPSLARLTELNLHNLILGDGELQALAGCAHLARLRALRLGSQRTVPYPGQINVNAVRALTHSPHLGALTTLDLSGQRLGLGSCEALADSPLGQRLQELDLSRNRARDLGTAALARSLPRLRKLHLGNNRLEAEGTGPLGRAPFAGQLVALDLGNRPGEARANALGDAGVSALAEGRFPMLRYLSLAGNGVGDEGLERLARSEAVPALRVLDVSRNNLRAGALWALAASPLREVLTELVLNHNHLADQACDVFLGLPWPRLRRVVLDGNPISEARRRALGAFLGDRLILSS